MVLLQSCTVCSTALNSDSDVVVGTDFFALMAYAGGGMGELRQQSVVGQVCSIITHY